MEEQDLQLRDLTPVEPLLPAFLWPWWVWASLAAGLLLLVLLTVWLVRRKSSKSQTPPNLEDLAFRQALAALDALPGKAPGWWKSYAFSDGFHPTPFGHQLLAASVSRALARAGWL